MIRRWLQGEKLVLKEGNKLFSLNKKQFYHKHRLDGIIRISKEDQQYYPKGIKYLTHFNLQYCHHMKGRIYALPVILKSGHLTSKEEVLPILSFKGCLIAKCLSVRNNVNYNCLTKNDFKFSSRNISTVPELKRAILRRYTISMPELSAEDIISLGVSITTLKILGIWERWR